MNAFKIKIDEHSMSASSIYNYVVAAESPQRAADLALAYHKKRRMGAATGTIESIKRVRGLFICDPEYKIQSLTDDSQPTD